MSTRDLFWGKGGRCVRLTTYHPSIAEEEEEEKGGGGGEGGEGGVEEEEYGCCKDFINFLLILMTKTN